MEFEWDRDKAASNLRKHGVDFADAAQVFLDPFMLEYEDLGTFAEIRFNALGMVRNRLIFLVYTERPGRIRIISARKATRHERRQYHEG
ncbi:MAG: BrnT family toxin [Candidatus Odyssella sp.]|nr:BrnT family toxin [Candidatus Odyssella sp.]